MPLTEPALWAAEAMPTVADCEYVFYHPDSLTRWDEARDPWEKARVAASHDWRQIKDLRRAYGIRLAEKGCPMHFIQAVMGHSSVSITEKYYAQFSPDSASRAVLTVLEGGRRRGKKVANR